LPEATAGRLASLDLIRGIAVLGILAVNIGGFAGPSVATLSPNLPLVGSRADEIAFALKFLLFEGKMRALFSLLFGASLMLLIRRSDDAGQFGIGVQARRLGWLALFGLAHFYLLWWGDILFAYALAGLIALMLSEARPRTLLIVAGAVFIFWHGAGAAMSGSDVAREARVIDGLASAADARDYADFREHVRSHSLAELAALQGTFAEQAGSRIIGQALRPVSAAIETMGETLPLMLLGMVLLQSGFFAGRGRRQALLMLGIGGTAAGLALTGAILGIVWPRGFPPAMMETAFRYWTALPHLMMAMGYAAIIVLAAPRVAGSLPGRWLIAAGRMAFSNYIGTSLLMTAIFYGWGLGWIGRFGDAWQWAFVLLGWAAMIVFSVSWLARFRRGPLEWLWRSLVEGRLLANRK
jgi:uncharacterized protein